MPKKQKHGQPAQKKAGGFYGISLTSKLSASFTQTFNNVRQLKHDETIEFEQKVRQPLENYKNLLLEANAACHRRGLLLEAHKLQR